VGQMVVTGRSPAEGGSVVERAGVMASIGSGHAQLASHSNPAGGVGTGGSGGLQTDKNGPAGVASGRAWIC